MHPSSPTQAAMLKLEESLPFLAGALVAQGEPAAEPFARLFTMGGDPPCPRSGLSAPPPAAVLSLSPLEAAEQAIVLVHAVFHRCRASAALTAAAKRVGNAALGVKRAVAHEAARRDRIALLEARPVVPRVRSRRSLTRATGLVSHGAHGER